MVKLGFRIVRTCCPSRDYSNKFLGNEMHIVSRHIEDACPAVQKVFSNPNKADRVRNIERYCVIELIYIEDYEFRPVVNRIGESLDVRIGVCGSEALKRKWKSPDGKEVGYQAELHKAIKQMAKEVCAYFEAHYHEWVIPGTIGGCSCRVRDFANEFDPDMVYDDIYDAVNYQSVVMVDFDEVAMIG